VCTKLRVDSSSRFFIYSANTQSHRQTHKGADATDHPNHASATAIVGNDCRRTCRCVTIKGITPN